MKSSPKSLTVSRRPVSLRTSPGTVLGHESLHARARLEHVSPESRDESVLFTARHPPLRRDGHWHMSSLRLDREAPDGPRIRDVLARLPSGRRHGRVASLARTLHSCEAQGQSPSWRFPWYRGACVAGRQRVMVGFGRAHVASARRCATQWFRERLALERSAPGGARRSHLANRASSP